MKPQLRTSFTRMITILLLCVLIAGCTSNNNTKSNSIGQDSTTVQSNNEVSILRVFWWGNVGRQERTLKVIEKFEKAYPHIKIEWEDEPNSNYWVQIAMKTADQNMADVIQMDYKYIDEFVERKLLLPMDELVAEGKLNIDNLDASSLESGKINGQLYGVVTGINAPSFVYNKAMFEKYDVSLPSDSYTYEELLKISRELKAAANNADFYPIGSSSFDFSYYLRQRGASLYNVEKTGLGYTNDQFLSDFLTMEGQFIDEGLMAPESLVRNLSGEKESLLARELAAFHSITSNNVISYSNAIGAPLSLIQLPSYEGGEQGNYVKPSMYFSISSYTKQAENAALFIDFFFNNLEANEDLRGERGVPATVKVRGHLMSLMNAVEREQYVYMESVEKNSSPIDPPAPLQSGRVNTLLTKLKTQFYNKQISAEEAAAQFREGTNKIFNTTTN